MSATPRTGHRLSALAAIACTAVVVAGQAGTAYAGGTTESNAGAAEAYTACVRAHGVPDFPGVTLTEDGRVQLKEGADPLSSAYRQAAKECAGHLPDSSTLPATPAPPKGPAALDPPKTPASEGTGTLDAPTPPFDEGSAPARPQPPTL
jgi:hypothetical protein